MTGPPPATAAVRVAVRRAVARLDGPLAAAVSGGADSLALAAALAFERPGSYALVVDHGLQDGSAQVAARAAEQCRDLGLVPHVLQAAPPFGRCPQHQGAGDITQSGGSGGRSRGGGGPEAAARVARYAALDAAVAELGLAAVLLGHTLDDQAETVLLGLARGAGARALAGMTDRTPYRRPLLGIDRATTRAACAEAGLIPWDDPHNDDPAYARVRVRRRVLPVLEAELGPGLARALARTADQLRDDADALDALTPDTADVAELAALPAALRSRALKRWAERQCGSAVTSAHVDALRALVDDWHGQGPVALPGGVQVARRDGRLASDA
ncbi:MAG: tRNA(Ile)-lysidine synthetase [Frankiales bacterium]|nr:MAG: tRNA(Ile)-lysidine synthetase [Frankiales bacterium]